jgi:cell division protein FtsW
MTISTSLYKYYIKWYRSIEKDILASCFILFFASIILVSSTSPVIALKIGVPEHYFVLRQIIYLSLAFFIMIFISLFNEVGIRRLSIFGFCLCIILLVLVKIYGYEIKGAKRWINLLGFSMQPTEFLKPILSVLFGWLLSIREDQKILSLWSIAGLYSIVAILIITQPDLGMLVIITACLLIQLFASGIPAILVIASIFFGSLGLLLSYLFLPHVTERVNSFLFPQGHENYQVTKSLQAFERGGFFGVGPGEGHVKELLPDSHCDFIFAVSGEELGIIACLIIVCTFAFLTIKFLLKLMQNNDKFQIISMVGLISQIGLQSIINMGVTLNLLPTKGMTLPFISYGGSASLAMAINIGFLLSLTRKKISNNYQNYNLS